MKEGDVVLASLPQADGTLKNRPAVVLRAMPPFGDLLVCAVSRQVRHEVPNFDEHIRATDPDFKTSGLISDSLIRLGFLALLAPRDLLGKIGTISPARHRRLLANLAAHLTRQ